MKKIKMPGKAIKADNGSGYCLAQEFPGRRFHDKTVYVVEYHGINLDGSTVGRIYCSRNGWGK